MTNESLEKFVDSVCGESHLRVEKDLGDGFVRLRSAEAERRQAAHDIRSTEDIVIEMLRNARDAHASSIFLAVSREGTQRKLVMIDDGDGIPSSMHERVFEPRVTSKLDSMHLDKWGVHGRGMALYSISANAQTSRIVASDRGMGAAFLVETNLESLGEKTDQSTFPVFELTESGTVSVRGPKNILRTVCEFALESRQSCTVYVGSATEVVATLYAFGLSSLTAAMRAFSDLESLPLCKRLAVAVDPGELAANAAALGLVLSERSARRILDGEIAPLESLLERITIENPYAQVKQTVSRTLAKPGTDARGLKIAQEDLKAFTEHITAAYQSIAESYYLESAVKPEIRVSKDDIRIIIPIAKLR